MTMEMKAPSIDDLLTTDRPFTCVEAAQLTGVSQQDLVGLPESQWTQLSARYNGSCAPIKGRVASYLAQTLPDNHYRKGFWQYKAQLHPVQASCNKC